MTSYSLVKRSAWFKRASIQLLQVCAACALMEWSYYSTGSTFMATYGLLAKAGALFALFSVLWVGAWVVQLPLLVLTVRRPSLGPSLLSVAPTLIFCWQMHLILDRTFGLLSLSDGAALTLLRIGMFAIGGLVFLVWRRSLTSQQEQSSALTLRQVAYLHASIVTALALWVLGHGILSGFAEDTLSGPPPSDRPHVILLSTDGIESRSMSLYGSELDTTPFLAELANESVVYNNAFANAGKTTGSVTSMLSGVHPLNNKVMFPPHVLTGQHAYQHLPGLLRSWGYRGYQHGVRFYNDADDLNMIGAFDEANGRSVRAGWWNEQRAYNDVRYFIFRLWEWSAQKWWLLFTGDSGIDVFKRVTSNVGLDQNADRAALKEALEFIDASDGPVFLHLHLLGTHCCDFHSDGLSFTEEEANMQGPPVEPLRNRASYLSSIRDFDRMTQHFVGEIEARGMLDESILVFSSDHTVHWGTNERVPLMVRFPHAEHTGRVDQNVQLLSLPASILRWLGVSESPEWMWSEPLPFPEEAQSDSSDEPIVSISSLNGQVAPTARRFVSFARESVLPNPGAPGFGIGSITLIRCDSWSEFTVASEQWMDGLVSKHTRPCHGEARWTPEEKTVWLTHLEEEYGVQLME